MSTTVLRTLSVALAVACGSTAVAQSTGPPDVRSTPVVAAPAPVAVEVEASRLAREGAVRGFVAAVSTRPDGEEGALWFSPACPMVAGLPAAQAEYLLHRVSAVAVAAGVPLAGVSCEANLLLAVSADPAALIRQLRKSKPALFAGYSGAQVERFTGSDRPVRVWYGTERVGTDGAQLARGAGGDAVPEVGRMPNSRLERATTLALDSVIVIADSRQLSGVRLQTLADYLALVGLAEVNAPSPAPALPSILGLFSAPGGTVDASLGGLTRWDQAYLKAVYRADPRAALRGDMVVQRMLEDAGD